MDHQRSREMLLRRRSGKVTTCREDEHEPRGTGPEAKEEEINVRREQKQIDRRVRTGAQGMYRPVVAKVVAKKITLLGMGLLMELILVLSGCGSGAQAQGRKIPEDNSFYTKAHRIPAGKYVTDEFRPAMSFRLGDDWRTGPDPNDSYGHHLETSHNIFLSSFSESGTSYLEFLVVPKVYKVVSSYGAMAEPAPTDMVSWLQDNSNLDIEKPKQVSVGGMKGKQFDAVASHIPQEYVNGGYHAFSQDEPCLPLFQVLPAYGDESTYSLFKDYKVHFIVLDDVKGKTVTISVLAPAGKFDEFLAKAQKALDTVQWGGS
jgi:hypothetical protein